MDFDGLVLGPCVQAFGEPITIRPRTGPDLTALANGTPLQGVFEAALKEERVEHGEWVDSTRPVLGIRVNDLRSAGLAAPLLPEQGWIVLIRGIWYQITDAPPADGEGHIQLELARAQDPAW